MNHQLGWILPDFLDVSKNRATPKWMVYFMKNSYEQMDDLGVKTHIFGGPPFLIKHQILMLPRTVCGDFQIHLTKHPPCPPPCRPHPRACAVRCRHHHRLERWRWPIVGDCDGENLIGRVWTLCLDPKYNIYIWYNNYVIVYIILYKRHQKQRVEQS